MWHKPAIFNFFENFYYLFDFIEIKFCLLRPREWSVVLILHLSSYLIQNEHNQTFVNDI